MLCIEVRWSECLTALFSSTSSAAMKLLWLESDDADKAAGDICSRGEWFGIFAGTLLIPFNEAAIVLVVPASSISVDVSFNEVERNWPQILEAIRPRGISSR